MQIHTSVLGSDGALDPTALAVLAASAALQDANAAWGGPVGAAQVARVHGKLVASPSNEQVAAADLTLLYVGTNSHDLLLDMQARLGGQALPSAACLHQGSAVDLLKTGC